MKLEPRRPPMPPLPIGTRIYNGGDQANPSHFGTIVAIRPPTPFNGLEYVIKPDPNSEGFKEYVIPAVMVSAVYDGTGMTRIVLEQEHDRWRKEQMEKFYGKKARPVEKKKENEILRFNLMVNKASRVLFDIDFDTNRKVLSSGDYVIYKGEIYTVEHITKDTLLLEFYNGTEDMEDLDIKLNIDHYI